MARSKKDGKKGGGHSRPHLRKHQEMTLRRRYARRKEDATVMRLEEEASKEDEYYDMLELYDLLQLQELTAADFGWNMGDELEWERYNDRRYGMDISFDEDSYHIDLEYDNDERLDFLDYRGYEPDPSVDLMQAVDRLVRRVGAGMAESYAWVLAASFSKPTDEIIRAIRLTPAGYIR